MQVREFGNSYYFVHVFKQLIHVLFLIGSILILLPVPVLSQTKQRKAIDKESNTINSDSSLEKVIIYDRECPPYALDSACMFTGYFHGKEIKKISTWVGLSGGTEVFEYYYMGGELIFIHEQFNSFVLGDDGMAIKKTETTFIGRYYFDKGKLIDMETTGHNRFEDDTLDPEKTLLREADEHLSLFRRAKHN